MILQIYRDITEENYQAIIDYIKHRSPLRIVSSVHADLNSNYIFAIDPILPPKQEVLQYLEQAAGVVPMIKAKVIHSYSVM